MIAVPSSGSPVLVVDEHEEDMQYKRDGRCQQQPAVLCGSPPSIIPFCTPPSACPLFLIRPLCDISTPIPAASASIDGEVPPSGNNAPALQAKSEAAKGTKDITDESVVAQLPVVEDDTIYPQGLALWTLYSGLMLVTIVVGLDSNCVATIIPVITDQFHSSDDAGWYGIA